MSTTIDNNISMDEPITTHKPHVADAKFDKDIRIIVLYIEIIFGAIGGTAVCLWLWANRQRKSRVNKIILHVTISDLMVIFCASLPQLIIEYDREWKAGDAVCKIWKFTMSFAMMASNFMLVMLSVDRHEAIMHPLREPPRVWVMATVSWSLSALFSLPQFVIFHTNFVTASGPFYNMTLCESIFRDTPIWVRQAYLTYIGVVVFYIPLVIIVFCYFRIFLKIALKAMAGNSLTNNEQNTQQRKGKVILVSSQNSTLSSAKIKILKMSIVIITCFIICGLPYQILETVYSYGDHTVIPSTVAAIIGGMAVANSSINPFVFLLFNANQKCVNHFLPCCMRSNEGRPNVYDSTINRGYYPGNSATCMSEVTRLDSKRCKNVIVANGHSYTRINSTDNAKGKRKKESF